MCVRAVCQMHSTSASRKPLNISIFFCQPDSTAFWPPSFTPLCWPAYLVHYKCERRKKRAAKCNKQAVNGKRNLGYRTGAPATAAEKKITFHQKTEWRKQKARTALEQKMNFNVVHRVSGTRENTQRKSI